MDRGRAWRSRCDAWLLLVVAEWAGEGSGGGVTESAGPADTQVWGSSPFLPRASESARQSESSLLCFPPSPSQARMEKVLGMWALDLPRSLFATGSYRCAM